ncbi:hypothetical protein MBLNU459_g8076t1 [Dothideomycetes sp. NU459]
MSSPPVDCPICSRSVREADINRHLDSGCEDFLDEPSPPPTQQNGGPAKSTQVASFFHTPAAKRTVDSHAFAATSSSQPVNGSNLKASQPSSANLKRSFDGDVEADAVKDEVATPVTKKPRIANLEKAAPLAERMRPKTLDEVHGQELVGPNGVIRSLIEADRVPSMILWGGPGTGKTTIARLIAQTAGTRFVEINSTSTGVAECKKLFAEARNELTLTGRKTIIFCDEIHRFSKSQQDVFLGPVEAGTVTLIGATTENPSFKVANALMSRCRTFTLQKLGDDDILSILKRALTIEPPSTPESASMLEKDESALLRYLSTFADGDARTALNLLSLALDLSSRPEMTIDTLKSSLTQTLVYDRAGDQHYDTISAFHKSVRGSDPDAALYYLARMLQSGEDPLYVARRMVVIASEDVGLADNTLLSLATATYTAAEKIGMPECRINLGHCAVALALAPKSVRAYRGLNAAYAALREPGIAGLPVPVHLRNAPTRLMKDLGYGKEYKYNPDYLGGAVSQDYLPDKLKGRTFLDERDLGTEADPDLANESKNGEDAPDDHDRFEEGVLLDDGMLDEDGRLLNPDGD